MNKLKPYKFSAWKEEIKAWQKAGWQCLTITLSLLLMAGLAAAQASISSQADLPVPNGDCCTATT
ncbi:MAG: hypothetical protein HY790_09950 [Deltaproteobacteria bacterium]|nr:hypothetical protein [Deltaproteobacteria bacterium]